MRFSFQNREFDTERSTEVRYERDASIAGLADNIIGIAEEQGAGPRVAGFVADQYPFLSNLSIIENVVLPLEYHRGLTTRAAVEEVRGMFEGLGIEGIAMKRKEHVSAADLFKAMFVRAASMGPEVAFFINPENFVPVKEFERLIPAFRAAAGGSLRVWVGAHEGLRLTWEHDTEVSLDV